MGLQATDDGGSGNGYSVTPFGRVWIAESERADFMPTEPGRFEQLLKPSVGFDAHSSTYGSARERNGAWWPAAPDLYETLTSRDRTDTVSPVEQRRLVGGAQGWRESDAQLLIPHRAQSALRARPGRSVSAEREASRCDGLRGVRGRVRSLVTGFDPVRNLGLVLGTFHGMGPGLADRTRGQAAAGVLLSLGQTRDPGEASYR